MHPSSLARRTLVVCAALAGLAATTATRADVIIDNASFESPAYTLGGAHEYSPTNAGWTFISPDDHSYGSGISRQGSGGFFSTASDGQQVAFIQNGGSFRQDITLDAGSYTLSFYESKRSFGGGDGDNDFHVALGRNIIVPAHFAASVTPTLVHYDFSLATAGTYTLAFVGLNSEDGGDHTVFIDAVSIAPAATAVPTPAAALGALPLLALAAWKRRRA